MSDEEWQSIPDVGDSRNRKKRLAGLREKYTPISDRILSNGLGRSLNSALTFCGGGGMSSRLDPTSGIASIVLIPIFKVEVGCLVD